MRRIGGNTMNVFKGIPISPGFAIGKVVVKKVLKTEILLKEHMNCKEEKSRFHEARLQAIREVNSIYQQILKTKGEKEAAIFSAHISMLEDVELTQGVEDTVDELTCNAEWALKKVADQFIEIFKSMNNAYMQERAIDIQDISDRIQDCLSGAEKSNILSIKEPVIILANELTPSDTAQLKSELVLGIVNEEGGPTSHSAIIARMMGVPLVVYPNITNLVQDGQMMVFDGKEGSIYLEPTEEIINLYRAKLEQLLKKKAGLERLKGTKAITIDGHEVQLVANIGTPGDITKVLENDASGVGLFRTEFLYMSREDFPDEEEQRRRGRWRDGPRCGWCGPWRRGRTIPWKS